MCDTQNTATIRRAIRDAIDLRDSGTVDLSGFPIDDVLAVLAAESDDMVRASGVDEDGQYVVYILYKGA